MDAGIYIEKMSRKSKANLTWKPVILDLSKNRDKKTFKKIIQKNKVRIVSDFYENQEREYLEVSNPSVTKTKAFSESFSKYNKQLNQKSPWSRGRWIYYSWLSTIVHVLDEAKFQIVRTARNRDLLTEKEQKKFYNGVIGIAGLSVGNSIALSIALQGGGRHLRLADYDVMELSNSNRIKAGIQNLGLPKTVLTARQIYEINPYASLEIFSEGLGEKNIKKFFNGPRKLDIIIDELDNMAVKFLIREEAKKRKIPVVMAADNGDAGVIDIERYDLEKKVKFFHGRIGNISYEELLSLDKIAIGRLITKHVGVENISDRMQQSLLNIGKTIVSWPQLGGTALLNGAAVAYCVRRILNKQPLESRRAIISLDEKLIPNHRSKRVKNFKKLFNL